MSRMDAGVYDKNHPAAPVVGLDDMRRAAGRSSRRSTWTRR